jgi:putative flippase GtrA
LSAYSEKKERAGIARTGLRFLVAGLANTALTFAAYQLFLFLVPHQAAYALAWLCGIAFVVVVYPSRVFGKQDPTANSLVRFVISYVVTFLVGMATLQVLTSAGMSPRIAVVLVLMVTTGANFGVGRYMFR